VSPSPDAIARISRLCLANQGVSCRTCDELCEVDAIRFTPVANRMAAPAISEDACTGCGDCLGVCPVDAIDLRQR